MIFSSDIVVNLVQSNVSDQMVVDAARISVGSTSDPLKDFGLIKYLMKNKHGSPFEHGSLTFKVEAPIFVFREWHRHRAGWSYNEESGRYKELEPKFYIPKQSRIQTGKPGAYVFTEGSRDQTADVHEVLRFAGEVAWLDYQFLLEQGVAREVARMVLPLNIYSSMFCTANPRSLLHFLSLRNTNEAQLEIRMAAQVMEEHLKGLMPWTYQAYLDSGRVSP